MNSGYELFYRLVDTLSIGDEVSFKKKGSPKAVRGELRRLAATNEICLITIYSYFARAELTYRIDHNLELFKPEEPVENGSDELVYYDLSRSSGDGVVRRWIERIVLFVLLFSLIAPFIPELKLREVNYSYSAFLEHSFSLNELYDVVYNRVRYTYDAEDIWLTPRFSWQLRQGDCEELSVVYADYLRQRGIVTYIVGLYFRGRAKGHAVVFVDYEGDFYMVDLTKAVERMGIRRFKDVRTLSEAVSFYEAQTVTVYDIPGFNGDKRMLYNVD